VLLMLAFAFLGGLILNAMPCVFPVLSLKVLAVTKKAGLSHSKVKSHALAYTLGILTSFWLLSLVLLVIRQAGVQIGWGFQMQSPAFVIGLALVLYAVALNLSGLFDIPSLSVSGGKGVQQGATGSFMTGVLATVVATPCTAPFMAAAVGFALSQTPMTALAIFTALGLGLAAPFLLLSIFPGLIKALPKPGAWMETFRQFLAFPMYASCAWLVWVVAQQIGHMGLAYVFATLVLLPFAIWLWHALAHWPAVLRIIPAGGALLMALYCAYLATLDPRAAAGQTATPSATVQGQEAYSAERLKSLRDEGKPVFVTATAAWCITCKYNEAAAIHTKPVQDAFAARGIVYLVADWTNQDEAITRYLSEYGRKGVPLYVYYPPHGKPVVLPQVLTPGVVLKHLDVTDEKESD
jgi:thiol:disulfide interchange protein DsbD